MAFFVIPFSIFLPTRTIANALSKCCKNLAYPHKRSCASSPNAMYK